ncbi:MAG: NRDE family protein [Arenicellales bacterium]
MCFVAAALGLHPEFPLIVAANRDEYFVRPTQSLGRWSGSPVIVAGRDLTAGGTWLGLSEDGRFAALTNCRTETVSSKPGALSRGTIVRDFLLGRRNVVDAVANGTLASQSDYGGFNLIAGTINQISILCNATQAFSQATSGCFVLSNIPPQGQWPKIQVGRERFSEAIALTTELDALKNRLFSLLADSRPVEGSSDSPKGESLPEIVQKVIFVRGPDYGTRASTVILIDRKKQAHIFEKTFDNKGCCDGENTVHLELISRN